MTLLRETLRALGPEPDCCSALHAWLLVHANKQVPPAFGRNLGCEPIVFALLSASQTQLALLSARTEPLSLSSGLFANSQFACAPLARFHLRPILQLVCLESDAYQVQKWHSRTNSLKGEQSFNFGQILFACARASE